MNKISITTTYDGEWSLPFPDDLLDTLGSEKASVPKSWQELIDLNHKMGLQHGAGPEIAAILIAITSPLWEYTVEKLLDGLIKTVKSKWFSKASSKADEVQKVSKENHEFSRARNRKIKEAAIPKRQELDEPFPYALMNVAISSQEKSSTRSVQVLFPYPMTDVEAEKAVSELKDILNKVQPNSVGLMYFDKSKSKWVLQGNIKLYE
jgi:hypothetical protein